MIKVYEIARSIEVEAFVAEMSDDGAVQDVRRVAHVVCHSPTGFEYSYAGSGPADLALSILADYFGEKPTEGELNRGDCICWRYHQDFKFKFIATIPQDQDSFQISSEQIDDFVLEREGIVTAILPIDESTGFDFNRLNRVLQRDHGGNLVVFFTDLEGS